MDKAYLIENIRRVLDKPCSNDHVLERTAAEDFFDTDQEIFRITCGTETLDKRSFSFSDSIDNISHNVNLWMSETIIKHHLETAPEAIAEWIMLSGEVDESPYTDSLHGDIRHVLNKHSVENGGDIPDNILATYVVESLKTLNTAVRRRDRFFSFEPFPKMEIADNG